MSKKVKVDAELSTGSAKDLILELEQRGFSVVAQQHGSRWIINAESSIVKPGSIVVIPGGKKYILRQY